MSFEDHDDRYPMDSEETRAHAEGLVKIGYRQVAAYLGDADVEAKAAFVEAKAAAQRSGVHYVTSSVYEKVIRLWVKDAEASNK